MAVAIRRAEGGPGGKAGPPTERMRAFLEVCAGWGPCVVNDLRRAHRGAAGTRPPGRSVAAVSPTASGSQAFFGGLHQELAADGEGVLVEVEARAVVGRGRGPSPRSPSPRTRSTPGTLLEVDGHVLAAHGGHGLHDALCAHDARGGAARERGHRGVVDHGRVAVSSPSTSAAAAEGLGDARRRCA